MYITTTATTVVDVDDVVVANHTFILSKQCHATALQGLPLTSPTPRTYPNLLTTLCSSKKSNNSTLKVIYNCKIRNDLSGLNGFFS